MITPIISDELLIGNDLLVPLEWRLDCWQ